MYCFISKNNLDIKKESADTLVGSALSEDIVIVVGSGVFVSAVSLQLQSGTLEPVGFFNSRY